MIDNLITYCFWSTRDYFIQNCLNREGSLSCHTCSNTGPRFIVVLSIGLSILSPHTSIEDTALTQFFTSNMILISNLFIFQTDARIYDLSKIRVVIKNVHNYTVVIKVILSKIYAYKIIKKYEIKICL